MDLLDTADMYGVGKNEELVGRAIVDRRGRARVATKFAVQRDASGALVGISGRPQCVKSACEAGLRRLGIETMDLYDQHRVDRTVPIEDTIGAMANLVRAGKVLRIGLSEASAATIRPGPRAAFPSDHRRSAPRMQGENLDTNLALVDAIAELARARGVTSDQLALAWVLSRGPLVVAIPGTRRLERLEENVRAADLELKPDELARLDELAPVGAAAGDRHDARGMAIARG